MAKKHKHEDHLNHEAWAIPYGDLVTLLLALFVVLYAISSVNEGKYRVVADALKAEFEGAPHRMMPIEVGEPTPAVSTKPPMNFEREAMPTADGNRDGQGNDMVQLQTEINKALSSLIKDGTVTVRNTREGLEVEIQTDILFTSGTAQLSDRALRILEKVAGVLVRFKNPVRVEGHTDNMPIHNDLFPSNWELSASRATGVVHLFTRLGIDPARLTVLGAGEFQPQGDNATEKGRNRNRRVVLVIPHDRTLKEELTAKPEQERKP